MTELQIYSDMLKRSDLNSNAGWPHPSPSFWRRVGWHELLPLKRV